MAKGYKDLLLKEVQELFKKLPPNVRLRVYYEDMGKSKYTLNELGSRVDQLETRMDRIETRMDRIETKLNQIADALFEFIKATNARFDKLEKDFNTRLDLIEKRLDYNGLQIERIEKRLDYNNLKKLPETR